MDDNVAAPNQVVASLSRLDITNLTDATPPPNTRKESTTDTHSSKRGRSEAGRHTTHTGMNILSSIRSKENIPSIDIVLHMWLDFSIHEAIAIQKGEGIIHEHRTSEEFTHLGRPSSEIIELQTLRRAFPRVPQTYYPSERPDAVPGNHLHFTQLPSQEKIDHTTGLSEAFYITIRYDFRFKSMSKQEARSACQECLRQMDIPLDTTYSNPIDIGLNAVTKKWAGFIKVHLLHPIRDEHALLKGNRVFAIKMEDDMRVIGKIEKGFELATKARNLRIHLKGETLRHVQASHIFEEIVRESYYTVRQHEFMGLTKPELGKNFAFLTLTTEEGRDNVLKEGITFNHE